MITAGLTMTVCALFNSASEWKLLGSVCEPLSDQHKSLVEYALKCDFLIRSKTREYIGMHLLFSLRSADNPV